MEAQQGVRRCRRRPRSRGRPWRPSPARRARRTTPSSGAATSSGSTPSSAFRPSTRRRSGRGVRRPTRSAGLTRPPATTASSAGRLWASTCADTCRFRLPTRCSVAAPSRWATTWSASTAGSTTPPHAKRGNPSRCRSAIPPVERGCHAARGRRGRTCTRTMSPGATTTPGGSASPATISATSNRRRTTSATMIRRGSLAWPIPSTGRRRSCTANASVWPFS